MPEKNLLLLSYRRKAINADRQNILFKNVLPLVLACVFIRMGLVITPLKTPRQWNPLRQPLAVAENLGGRELVWNFAGGDITSHGGALLLKALEQRTGIIRRFAACFEDYRRPDLIEHPLLDLITQRVFGLILGYDDLIDHDDLRADPMLAVALARMT